MGNHPMPGGVVLYMVRGPRGSYYAVHDPGSGRVFTERTDHAARAQAQELGLIVMSAEEVSHQELLRRTGREADAASQAPTANRNPQPLASPQAETFPGQMEINVLPPQIPFLLDDTGESVIAGRGAVGGALFSSHPLEPQYSDLAEDTAIWGNMPPVLNPPEEDWQAPERQ
ncbi:MAG TPA: hypothetical protein VIM11_27660 [Tepidisphaeraceae bacterium]|jgi:hypothetical protein